MGPSIKCGPNIYQLAIEVAAVRTSVMADRTSVSMTWHWATLSFTCREVGAVLGLTRSAS